MNHLIAYRLVVVANLFASLAHFPQGVDADICVVKKMSLLIFLQIIVLKGIDVEK